MENLGNCLHLKKKNHSNYIIRTAVFEFYGFWELRFLSTADPEYDHKASGQMLVTRLHQELLRCNFYVACIAYTAYKTAREGERM